MTGVAVLGAVELGVKISLDEREAADGSFVDNGVRLELDVANDGLLPVSSALEHLVGVEAVKATDSLVPSDIGAVPKADMMDAQIVVTTKPLRFEATGEVAILQLRSRVAAHIVVEQNAETKVWGFGMSVQMATFTIGELLPSIGQAAPTPPLGEGALVIASMDHPFTLKTQSGTVVTAQRGFALAATMHATGPLAFLQKWTGIESLGVAASYNFDTEIFHLEGDINMDWTMGALTVSQASCSLTWGASRGLTLASLAP